MKQTFLAGAAFLLIACDTGDRSPHRAPPPFTEDTTRDTLVVDSSQATIFRQATFRATRMAPGDSSVYKLNWRVSGFATGDTVQVRLVRDSVAGKVKRVSITKNRFTPTGSVDIGVDKVFGTQASYSACTRLRKTAVKSEFCIAWKTNYAAKPGVDTMWVDSALAIAKLDIKPDKVNLEFGQKQQFCAYIVFLNGKVALRTQDKSTPECDEMYKQFSLTQRDITIKQQQRADSTCVKWEATGGTITAETCGPNNPLTGQPA